MPGVAGKAAVRCHLSRRVIEVTDARVSGVGASQGQHRHDRWQLCHVPRRVHVGEPLSRSGMEGWASAEP